MESLCLPNIIMFMTLPETRRKIEVSDLKVPLSPIKERKKYYSVSTDTSLLTSVRTCCLSLGNIP